VWSFFAIRITPKPPLGFWYMFLLIMGGFFGVPSLRMTAFSVVGGGYFVKVGKYGFFLKNTLII